MIAPLVLGGFAWLWYWLLLPIQLFLQRFALLLNDPHVDFSFLRIFSRNSSVTGRYHGRTVIVLIQRPIEDSLGFVRVSMTTSARGGEPWKDSTLTMKNADISRATFELEGRYEMILALDDGWFHATWRPRSEWRFPGRFDEARWRRALEEMSALVAWMERR